MKTSRRAFLGWAGAGLVGATAAGRIHAKERAKDCELMALGVPSAIGVGEKYDNDGKALSFPGNTVLSHLNKPGRTLTALTQVAAALRAKVGDSNITWTPPSSYHVTVFDGSLDSRRRPGDWPHLLPLDASLDECNRYIGERLKHFKLDLELPIRMVADETLATRTTMQFPLRPINDEENKRLRHLRDRLTEATGIRHPNHDSYGFHSTFGYYIRPFETVAEERRYQSLWLAAIRDLRRRAPVIELGAPEYCLFDTMNAFQTQFLLARK